MFSDLFDVSDFPARWHCGNWTAFHGWVHIIADTAIGGAYAAIPLSIAYFLRKRRDVHIPSLWWLFAGFIASCGFGHFVEATIFWHPWYRFSALIKVITALVSWATVIALIRNIPTLLSLPRIHHLNAQLSAEVEQRKKTEAERERFFDLALDMFCIGDFGSHLLRCNPAFETTLGYSREELLKTRFFDLLHPDDLPLAMVEMEKMERGEVMIGLEVRVRTKAGGWCWTAWKASPDLESRLVYATARDMTEYHRVADSLRSSETEARRLALVAARTDNAVIITDRDGLTEWVNEGFVRVTGYTLEEVRGRKPGSLLQGAKTDPAAVSRMREAIQAGKGFQVEVLNYHKSGREYWISIEGQPLFDDAGKLTSYMAIQADITGQKIAQEKLRASEAYNRSIVESTADSLEVLSLNGGWIEAAGSDPSSAVKTDRSPSWIDRWEKQDRVAAASALSAAASGEACRFQAQCALKNGSVEMKDVVISPIRGADGLPERLLAVSRDITQQHAVEEALRDLNATLEDRVEKRARELAESQARFHSAMHNSAVGMALVRLDGRYLEVNASMSETLGYTADELKETNFQAITYPEDLPADLQNVSRLRKGQIPSYRMEKRYLHKDGSIIWADLCVSLARDTAGVPLYFISQVQDITERKHAEFALIQSEERFRLLVEHVQDYAIFMLNPEGRVVSWNKGAERTTGYTAAEIIGKELFTFHPEGELGALASRALLAQASKEGHAEDEGWRRRKDGTTFWAELVLAAVTDPAGTLLGYATVTHDLTKRRETEAHSLRSQRLEAVGNLASGVAHDLNNALGPIVMGLEILREAYPKESTIIETFEACGQRAADMVRQLLTFARGTEGKRINVQPVYLIKEMQKIMTGTLPKNIHSVWDWPPDLRMINGDPTQIHQILLNLCVNARDAMPDGGTLTVQASNIEVDEAFAASQEGASVGSYVRFDVRDTGQGIPPQIIDRIFEPFFTTKSLDKGTGLGLATVLGIVKGHGGFLQVQSQPGVGTTFSFFLPVSDLENGLEAPVPEFSVFRGKEEKILVVDDEQTIREISLRVLHRLNFQAITATDGADALIHLVENRQDLHAVITDMHMPHMDGIALIRAIRRLLPDLPIIVSSGRLEESDKREIESLKVNGFLQKPFTELEFSRVLQEALASPPQPVG